MPDRAGPPSPRNKPYDAPRDLYAEVADAIMAQPRAARDAAPPDFYSQVMANQARARKEIYAIRDEAFREWAARGLCLTTAGERAFAKAVFDAGWEARKRAQYAPGAALKTPGI